MVENKKLFGANQDQGVDSEGLRRLHQEFLALWPIERLEKMKLSEYVNVGDKDTFCQWVETRTRPLGSIKGNSSLKFGIYKRQKGKTPPKHYASDEDYTWRKINGADRREAYTNVRSKVVQVAKLSSSGNFSEIEEVDLNRLFKWKVAYLYSNEQLLPIYNNGSLKAIAEAQGLDFSDKKSRSKFLLEIVARRPASLSIYEYAHELYSKYGVITDRRGLKEKKKKPSTRGRKGTTKLSQRGGKRLGVAPGRYEDRHTPLQKALFAELKLEYPYAPIEYEDNYVDIKVWLPNKILFFEVKTRGSASDHIKDGLGQLLAYVKDDNDPRPKEIVVAGAVLQNDADNEFIKFLAQRLDIPFSYRVIESPEVLHVN